MILDRIRQLESRAELARNDGSLKQDLKKAEGVRGRVSILGRLLEKVTAAYKEISAVKPIECAAVLTDLRSLREGIAQMTAQSRTQPLFGATPVFAQSLMLQEKMANAAEKSLEEIWTTYRKDQQESFVDRDFLEILGRSGLDVEALLERLDAASFLLERLDERTLPRQGDTARLQDAIAGLRNVAEGLSGVVPEALAIFFRQADTQEGAPLAALTPEVLAFLEEHNLTDRYSIRGNR